MEVLLRNDTGDPVPFERGKVIITLHFTLLSVKMTQNNPYVNYYLNQQQGHGMSVFRGSPWQIGHGQVGFCLGGLFRSVARAVMPMIKRGANALGNIALNSGANFVGDVLAGKNAGCIGEVADVAKKKVIQRVNTYAQTGNGKREAKQAGNTAKASQPASRNKQAKKRKTSPEDIFG